MTLREPDKPFVHCSTSANPWENGLAREIIVMECDITLLRLRAQGKHFTPAQEQEINEKVPGQVWDSLQSDRAVLSRMCIDAAVRHRIQIEIERCVAEIAPLPRCRHTSSHRMTMLLSFLPPFFGL